MIDINKLLDSKRLEITITSVFIDKNFVKAFRLKNHLTQVALANIMGVSKKTIEKWEQGKNNINGSSAVLFKLLDDNPELLNQLYSVNTVEKHSESKHYQPIAEKDITLNQNSIKNTLYNDALYKKLPLVAII